VKVLKLQGRIDALGARVVFVAFDTPGRLAEGLVEGIDLPWPLAVDTARESYRDWGLHRIRPWRLFLDPAVWKAYATLLLKGERLRPGGADPYQLGGDFVVDADGQIAWARPQARDDRPPVGHLLRALKATRAGGGARR
jgi:hypothetical protein